MNTEEAEACSVEQVSARRHELEEVPVENLPVRMFTARAKKMVWSSCAMTGVAERRNVRRYRSAAAPAMARAR